MQDLLVRLPMASSVIISVTPNVIIRIRYVIRKIPSPYCSTRYGKRHRFPIPTADPVAARMNSILLEKVPCEATFSVPVVMGGYYKMLMLTHFHEGFWAPTHSLETR